jgi:peptide/nickel transport system substrate-binding protein
MFKTSIPQRKALVIVVSIVAILSFLASCAAPSPVVQEVTRVVKETSVVKETQVVTVKETEVVTVKETQIVKLVYGNLPRDETLIIAGTASNDVWDTFTTMAGALTNAYSGHQQVAVEQAFLYAAGKYYPHLAQKWEYNADGTQFTLYITTNATWNDGKPVTMDDWTFTLDYLHANKDKGVPFGNLLDTASYKADGTDKIVFSFFEEGKPDTPRTNWRFHQTIAGFVPLAKHIWDGQDPVTFKNNPPVEAGPYTLMNCNADTKTCIWQRRDDYWMKDAKLSPKYIVFTRQPAPDLLTQEMINGSYDLSQLNPKIAKTVAMAKNKNISMIEWPDPCPRHLWFNTQRKPMDDPLFRRAMSLLIDRKRAGNLDNPPATPMLAHWPYQGDAPDPKLADPADIKTYDVGVFDPAKAAKMLDDAGYVLKDGKRVDKAGKPISLEVMTFDPSIHGAAVNGFPQMMAEEAAKIGLEILPKVVEVGVYFDNSAKGNFDMMYQWVCGAAGDPIAAYSPLHSRYLQPEGTAATGNPGRYNNPDLDALVEKVEKGNPADPAMSDLYKQLYKITAEDAPYVPLFFLYQGYPWNNEYFTGPTNQVEPWYWIFQFRGLLMFIDKTAK